MINLQVLVEAQLEDNEEGPGSSVSVMLQNAETVTLLGPSDEVGDLTTCRTLILKHVKDQFGAGVQGLCRCGLTTRVETVDSHTWQGCFLRPLKFYEWVMQSVWKISAEEA